MRSMRSVSTIILFGMSLCGLAACSPALLMNTPVSKSADGWGVTLAEVKEGPNEYVAEGGILLAPDHGEKLVWATVTVKNERNQEETFSYDTCILDGKGQSRRPLTVNRPGPEVNQAADRSEPIEAGQGRTRQLIYSFPQDQRPVRMRCGAITLPIPAAR